MLIIYFTDWSLNVFNLGFLSSFSTQLASVFGAAVWTRPVWAAVKITRHKEWALPASTDVFRWWTVVLIHLLYKQILWDMLHLYDIWTRIYNDISLITTVQALGIIWCSYYILLGHSSCTATIFYNPKDRSGMKAVQISHALRCVYTQHVRPCLTQEIGFDVTCNLDINSRKRHAATNNRSDTKLCLIPVEQRTALADLLDVSLGWGCWRGVLFSIFMIRFVHLE